MATTFQIEYWKHKEQQRSNRADEKETHRSNVARERENYRSNTAREKEAQRANLANELIGRDKNRITEQYNRENISATNRRISNEHSYNMLQNQVAREELARKRRADAETHRHNKVSEVGDLLGSSASGITSISKLIDAIT